MLSWQNSLKKKGRDHLHKILLKIFPDERETDEFSLLLHFIRPAKSYTVQSTHKYLKVTQSKMATIFPKPKQSKAQVFGSPLKRKKRKTKTPQQVTILNQTFVCLPVGQIPHLCITE